MMRVAKTRLLLTAARDRADEAPPRQAPRLICAIFHLPNRGVDAQRAVVEIGSRVLTLPREDDDVGMDAVAIRRAPEHQQVAQCCAVCLLRRRLNSAVRAVVEDANVIVYAALKVAVMQREAHLVRAVGCAGHQARVGAGDFDARREMGADHGDEDDERAQRGSQQRATHEARERAVWLMWWRLVIERCQPLRRVFQAFPPFACSPFV